MDIKSCGKSHPWCHICRPDIVAKVSTRWNSGLSGEVVTRVYQLQVCGKQHAYCSVCNPDLTTKIRAVLNKYRHKANRSHTSVFKGLTKETSPIIAMIAEKLRGRSPSLKEREAISMAQKKRYQRPSEHVKSALAAAKAHARGAYFRNPTCLEYALQMLLESAKLEYEAQVRFGRYVVDAYVPSRNLVFEADGSFWSHHKDKQREAKRDAYLVDKGAAAVVHLNEQDLNPWRIL